MAATAQADRLTEAHRLAQARLAAETTALALAAWALLDPEDLAGTTGRWLTVLLPILAAQRRKSALLAANYLTTFRTLELGMDADPFTPTLADVLDTEATTTSLLLTGPAKVRAALARQMNPAKAVDLGRAESARAAARHVLNGGRSTILDSVASDKKALGWSRTTSGKTCHFCTMLASRGAVYRSQDTADFHSHDGCNCSAEPVYRRDAALPPSSQRAAELYRQAKNETPPGEDVLNTLRRITAGT